MIDQLQWWSWSNIKYDAMGTTPAQQFQVLQHTCSCPAVRSSTLLLWIPKRHLSLKGHWVVLGNFNRKRKIVIDWFFTPKYNLYFMNICFHDWINWINKLTLQNNKVSSCFTLFVVDPATFLASNSLLGTLLNSLFIQLWRKKKISKCVLSPH